MSYMSDSWYKSKAKANTYDLSMAGCHAISTTESASPPPKSISTRTTRTPAFWGYPPPPHDYPHYWIPSQKNNRSRTENVTEQTRFSKSRSNDLEDIGQGQRSSHATHLLMLVIICTKYGKNPSRTVDATERTRFSRWRPNDLEDIGQG